MNGKPSYYQIKEMPKNNIQESVDSFHQGALNEFEAIFNYSSIGIVIANARGEIINFNHFAQTQFGYTKEEVIGKTVELLIPNEVRSKHVAHREGFIAHPANRAMGIGRDLFAKRKDNSVFPVEISLSHFSADGQHFVIGFIIDITVRKLNELEVVQQKEELVQVTDQVKKMNAELEQKIEDRTKMLKEILESLEKAQKETTEAFNFQKAILNNAGACIIGTDLNGIVQLFNPTAEEYLGYTKEEAINKINITQFHLEEELKAYEEEFSKALGIAVEPGFSVFVAKSIKEMPNEHEWTYVRKNGSHFTVSLNVTALRDAQNKVTSYLGVAIDISVLKKYQKDLQKALEKERQLGDLKSRFVTMASHEFRTPLSTILSSVSLIDRYSKEEDAEKREKHIKRIKHSVGNMKDILEDFLSLGKMEEGKVELNIETISAHKLKREVDEIVNEMQRLTKIGQKIEYNHNVVNEVQIDSKMLRHILTNLISNSIKFSFESSFIKVNSYCAEGELVFSVQDSGIGISDQDQKHLFERFFRAENASNIQGTGLGLHIIGGYLDLAGGRIEMQSKLNEGSIFKVFLPQS